MSEQNENPLAWNPDTATVREIKDAHQTLRTLFDLCLRDTDPEVIGANVIQALEYSQREAARS